MDRAERLARDGWRDGDPEPVLFYAPRDKNGIGSNFSRHGLWMPHPFTGEMAWYDSGEHRFQAMKGRTLIDHEHVRTAGSPTEAKNRGGPQGIELRAGWGNRYGALCWYAMLEVVMAKVEQHAAARMWAVGTGRALIYEDSAVDDIWGWRYRNDYRGKNLLGQCWMDVRRFVIGTT